ncbi:myo-inositol-1(or 4)-monophosphatase [Pseudochelatococcus lubricantis]|uniref:Myo-inositol-1(Or 4)-monophosphatase n=1 Tax=Pseudochelatococcus lubricantis TaxID=1538102 RepID=A0ABX0V2Z8_9HYPH|nr:inositol monophosphatase family protein [Pseudochelatococcus lubricantis]NIJ58948.1 myo-inositol-1(or 4)-monophosphatase [Pseudochelatococcus lubricantis]
MSHNDICPQDHLQHLFTGASGIVDRAAQLLVAMQARSRSVSHKELRDIVTDADIAAEELLIDGLRKLTPEADILAEETGETPGNGRPGTAPLRWIVDPLDGTVNYANGLPLYSVTVAAQEGGETVLGIVQSPAVPLAAAFLKGGMATVNGRPARVSDVGTLADAIVCVSLTSSYEAATVARTTEIIRRLANRVRGIRVIVSGAFELSLVAAGQVDAFVGLRTDVVSHAAGMALVRAAGGMVTTLSGAPATDSDRERVFSNGRLHDAILREIGDV